MIKQIEALPEPYQLGDEATCGCKCSASGLGMDLDLTLLLGKTSASTFEGVRRAITDPEDPPG